MIYQNGILETNGTFIERYELIPFDERCLCGECDLDALRLEYETFRKMNAERTKRRNIRMFAAEIKSLDDRFQAFNKRQIIDYLEKTPNCL